MRRPRLWCGVIVGLLWVLGACDSLRARMLASDGAKLVHDGRMKEAEAKYQEAARTAPDIPELQLNIAFINIALYQQDAKSSEGQAAASRAIEAYERYVTMKPKDEAARQYLVQAFVDTGRYDEAVAFFRDRADPPGLSAEELGILGIVASKTGRFAEARDWYRQRIQLEPNHAEAQLGLGVLIWDYLHLHKEVVGDARRGLANEGIEALEAAIRVDPKAPNPWVYENLLYRERADAGATDEEKLADLQRANEYYKKAMELQKASK